MGQIEETQNELFDRCNHIELKYGTPESAITRPTLRLVTRQGDPNYGNYVLVYMVPEGKRDFNLGPHFEARFTGNTEETVIKTATHIPTRSNGERYIASSYELELDSAVARHFEIPKTIWLSTASKYVRSFLSAKLRPGAWHDFRVLEYGSHRPDGAPMSWTWPVVDWWGLGFGGVVKKFNRLEEVHRERAQERSR